MKESRQISEKLFIFILFLAVLVQGFVYFKYPSRYEFEEIKDSIIQLVATNGKYYRTPRSAVGGKMYEFSKMVDRDIPLDARVQFINDSNDGTDMDRYFRISMWFSRVRKVDYNFERNPNLQDVEKIMKRSGSRYLVTYSENMPFYNFGVGDRQVPGGKLYRMDKEGLALERQYD